MRITMVKKRLADGSACDKCVQTEQMLRRRELWSKIDEVVWVVEGDDGSVGAELSRVHGVKVAPFFILTREDGSETVYTSPLRLIRDHLSETPAKAELRKKVDAPEVVVDDVRELAERFAQSDPALVVQFALERFGTRCPIVLTGAEDVVLLDMASKSGLPFRVVFVDSGREHGETYALIDDLRRHYGVEIACTLPDSESLASLLNRKGQNSFLRDGHDECCGIRRRDPLMRVLQDCDAWMGLHRTGREPSVAASVACVELDVVRRTAAAPRLRFSPLINWSSDQIWSYIRKHEVPSSALYAKGYRHIGCQPCTRAIRPDQEDREGLWWWEREDAAGAEVEYSGDGI